MPGWLDPAHDCDDGYWDDCEPDFDDLSDPLNDVEWQNEIIDMQDMQSDEMIAISYGYQYDAHVAAYWRQLF